MILAQPVDHRDEHLHFFLQPIDWLEVDVTYRYFRHNERSFNVDLPLARGSENGSSA